MSIETTPDFQSIRRQVQATIHAHWKFFLIQGVIMVVLGMIAVTVPNIATLEIELLLGWLLIVGGFLRAVTIFRRRHMPGFWWSLLNGVLSMLLGLVLIARPGTGVITLTFVMTVFFVVEGIAAIFIALDFRRHLHNWGWTLFSGLVNLGLAYLIWAGWPSSAAWVIGLFVGINMIFFGVSLVMTAIAAHSIGPA
jgi:uncharacterized membrane protein HdeD (DUF308 family)